MQPSPILPPDLVAAFWARVDHAAGIFDCWPWTGSVDKDGYGLVQLDKRRMKTRRASRLALALALGRELAPDEQTRHTCDNPPCCNPAHLLPGTAAQNSADQVARGRTLKGAANPMNTRPDRRPRGSLNGHARLDEQRVAVIKARLLAGEPVYRIAHAFGVTPGAVYFIRSGANWAHVAPAGATA